MSTTQAFPDDAPKEATSSAKRDASTMSSDSAKSPSDSAKRQKVAARTLYTEDMPGMDFAKGSLHVALDTTKIQNPSAQNLERLCFCDLKYTDSSNKHAVVKWVVPGSLFAKAGIIVGDVLMSIDGEKKPLTDDEQTLQEYSSRFPSTIYDKGLLTHDLELRRPTIPDFLAENQKRQQRCTRLTADLSEPISNVLQQLHPNASISAEGTLFVVQYLEKVVVMVVDELTRHDLSEVTGKTLEDAFISVIGGELAKMATNEMRKANGASPHEGLQYSSTATTGIVHMFGLPASVTIANSFALAFAGMLQYMTEEVLDLSGNAMYDEWRARKEDEDADEDAPQLIIPKHVYYAVHEDKECNSVVIKWSNCFLYGSFASRKTCEKKEDVEDVDNPPPPVTQHFKNCKVYHFAEATISDHGWTQIKEFFNGIGCTDYENIYTVDIADLVLTETRAQSFVDGTSELNELCTSIFDEQKPEWMVEGESLGHFEMELRCGCEYDLMTFCERQNIEYDKLSDILHDVIEGGGMTKYVNFEVSKECK